LGSVLGVLLVTLGLLAIIELVAGFFVAEKTPPPEIPGDTVSRTIAWLEVNPAPLVRDADLLWRNEPNARKTQPVNPVPFGRALTWTLENNAEGFRSPPRRAADDPAVFRILTVGDSITFGFNVDQPDTYPSQLERLLAARHPGRRFEVVNAGVPGWSWIQGLRFLELHLAALRPHALVMGHGTNDQFLPAKVTDEERLHMLGGPVIRGLRSAALRLTASNSFRLFERFLPSPGATDWESPGCKAQIAATRACHRVSLEEVTAAASAAHRLASGAGVQTLMMNLDFVETLAVRGLESAVKRDAMAYRNAVRAVRQLEKRSAETRATSLGLAQATTSAGAPAEPGAAKHVVLRFVAPDRDATYSVRGKTYFGPDFTIFAAAHDDGRDGDERGGDGVYSATVDVPTNVGGIQYLYYRDDEPELRPLPPMGSSVGDRTTAVQGDVLAPVDVFGELEYMAERAHPNREGQAVIAGIVAEWLETLPSFQRFVAPSGS